MRLRTAKLFFAIAVAATLVLAACGDDDDLDTTSDGGATQPVGSGDFDDTPDAAADCAAEVIDCNDTGVQSPGDVASMCLEGTTDCNDTPDAGGDPDAVDEGALIREAEAMIGRPEAELAADVRIARRGDETFALTEDYRIGRFTVELTDEGDGFRVTQVVLELTEGPQTFR